MNRPSCRSRWIFGALGSLCLAGTQPAQADPADASPPTTYEISINGESFLIEADRLVKLESTEKPGTVYQVALRVATVQRLRMNTLQFDYDMPASVEQDAGKGRRSAKLLHELGYTMLVTDLGGPVDAKGCTEALNLLVKSVQETVAPAAGTTLEIGPAKDQRFQRTTAKGVRIQYRDEQNTAHVYLVYVLSAPQFAATCVFGYVERDAENALPLIKKTLDSVRALEKRG